MSVGRSDNVKHGRHFVWWIEKAMGNLLYVVAVVLIVIWAIGYFGYHAGGLIHLVLVVALIVFLLKLIRRAD